MAYDETTVPVGDSAPSFPYITYNFKSGSFNDYGDPVMLSGSLWYRGTSWAYAEQKADEIAAAVKNMNPLQCDTGYIWIRQDTIFAERLSDPSDDMIRRIRIGLDVKFITVR